VIQAPAGQVSDGLADVLPTTTTPLDSVFAPVRAARDLRAVRWAAAPGPLAQQTLGG
jgi:hypothetical protein